MFDKVDEVLKQEYEDAILKAKVTVNEFMFLESLVVSTQSLEKGKIALNANIEHLTEKAQLTPDDLHGAIWRFVGTVTSGRALTPVS